MTHIVLPDALVWEAGIEYGLEAVAALAAETKVNCAVRDDGPMLEAIAFAVHQLALGGVVRFTDDPCAAGPVDVVLAPRLAPLGPLSQPSSARLVTSDPMLLPPDTLPVPKRDAAALTAALRDVLTNRG